MSGYYARIWSALAGFAVLCAVILVPAIGELRTNPGDGIGEIVAVAVGTFLAIFGALCVFWVRSETARNRRAALSARSGTRWLGDIRTDAETLAVLVERSDAGIEDEPMKSSYALTVGGGRLELWGRADAQSPVVRLPLDAVISAERLPAADTARGSGEFGLTLRDPDQDVELSLVGPLWGGYAATPGSVDRFVEAIAAERVESERSES